MRPKLRIPTHPGEVLLTDLLEPMGVSPATFAAHIGVPVERVRSIIRGTRGVNSQTAWLLAGALGTTPEFWMNLQIAHDLAANRPAQRVARLRARR